MDVPRASPAAAPAGPSCLQVDRTEELARIAEPQWNLCYLRREYSAALAASLNALAGTREFYQFIDGWRSEVHAAQLVAQVCTWNDSLQKEWAADIELLLDLFCAIAGTQRIQVKLASTWRTDCPVFHTDYVPLRLLCTYAGSGTEFVDEANVRHGALGCTRGRTAHEANQDIIWDLAKIRRLQPFDVAICKGALYPECRGRGLVHRSPRVGPGSPARIKLTIDAVGS